MSDAVVAPAPDRLLPETASRAAQLARGTGKLDQGEDAEPAAQSGVFVLPGARARPEKRRTESRAGPSKATTDSP